MVIHVVAPGETIYSIAEQYGVSAYRLAEYNGFTNETQLAVGQTIVILFPSEVYTVQPGDTLYEIAVNNDTTVVNLYQNNPQLSTATQLFPGEQLVLSFTGEKIGRMSINGYCYPYIDRGVLVQTLPYLTYITIFTYGFTPEGELIGIDDQEVVDTAISYGVAPIMLLSTFTEEGNFSNILANAILNNMEAQDVLINNIIANMRAKGYYGLDVDFEYILPEDREAYTAFITNVTNKLNEVGYFVIVALAPKTSSDMPGLLYEAHDYAALGNAANYVLLMTYEWGYTYGPPMAVSPINKVREVLDYAVTQIPRDKIYMGVPNYGYDWPLPFIRGVTAARSIGNVAAAEQAARVGATIEFDEVSQAPYYYYTSPDGVEHVVWFEDARSIDAKVRLVPEYEFVGVSYWNIMRFFPQNWLVVNALFDINKVI